MRAKLQIRVEQTQDRINQLKSELGGLPDPLVCPHATPALEEVGCPVFADRKSLLKKLRRFQAALRKLPDPAAALWKTFAHQRGNLTGAGFIREGLLTDKGKLALAAGPGGVFFAEILSRTGPDAKPVDIAGWVAGCLCEKDDRRGPIQSDLIKESAALLRQAGIPVMYSPMDAQATQIQ